MIVQTATVADAEEILALQKLSYQSEAEIYQDQTIPPLTQTIEELRGTFDTHLVLKATVDGEIIGSVQGRFQDGTCHIGRLMVHPRFQGKGMGTLLMAEIEDAFPKAQRYELFTGHLSERNLYLYHKLGYRVFRTQPMSAALTLKFMEKSAAESTSLQREYDEG